jgi:hypothetical protein
MIPGTAAGGMPLILRERKNRSQLSTLAESASAQETGNNA